MALSPKILAAAALFVVLTLASLILPGAGKGGFGGRLRWPFGADYITDSWYWLATPAIGAAIGRIVALLLAVAAALIYAEGADPWQGFGPAAAPPPLASGFAALVCADFANYWVHRAMHTARLWPLHAVHHSSQELNWHSALRIHPLDRLAMRLGTLALLLALGFPLGSLAGAGGVAGLIGILIHIRSNRDFGPLRYAVATPLFHRWHHAADADAHGRNFAGIFPLWDLLFGTFFMPRGRVPAAFGPASPLASGLRAQVLAPVAALFSSRRYAGETAPPTAWAIAIQVQNAAIPVIARPRISAWTSCVPS